MNIDKLIVKIGLNFAIFRNQDYKKIMTDWMPKQSHLMVNKQKALKEPESRKRMK